MRITYFNDNYRQMVVLKWERGLAANNLYSLEISSGQNSEIEHTWISREAPSSNSEDVIPVSSHAGPLAKQHASSSMQKLVMARAEPVPERK